MSSDGPAAGADWPAIHAALRKAGPSRLLSIPGMAELIEREVSAVPPLRPEQIAILRAIISGDG